MPPQAAKPQPAPQGRAPGGERRGADLERLGQAGDSCVPRLARVKKQPLEGFQELASGRNPSGRFLPPFPDGSDAHFWLMTARRATYSTFNSSISRCCFCSSLSSIAGISWYRTVSTSPEEEQTTNSGMTFSTSSAIRPNCVRPS